MLGNIPEPSRSEENELGYDPDYDQEVNKLLEEVEEELLVEDSTELTVQKDTIVKADQDQYEDFYDEFAPEEPIREIPLWYSKIVCQALLVLKKKNVCLFYFQYLFIQIF